MAIKFDKIKAGSILLDIHSESAGNTTRRRLGCWTVKVIEVQQDGAIVSWNGNRPEFRPRSRLEKLYLKPTKAYLRQNPGSTMMGKL